MLLHPSINILQTHQVSHLRTHLHNNHHSKSALCLSQTLENFWTLLNTNFHQTIRTYRSHLLYFLAIPLHKHLLLKISICQIPPWHLPPMSRRKLLNLFINALLHEVFHFQTNLHISLHWNSPTHIHVFCSYAMSQYNTDQDISLNQIPIWFRHLIHHSKNLI